jgi:hypothetical protein
MDQDNLAHRIAKLEEVEKIKELRQNRFTGAGLPELDVEAVVQLFAEDGEVEYKNLGKAKGHEAIRRFFGNDPVHGRFYCMVPAYVHVNDDLTTGRGRWYLLETIKIPSTKSGRSEPVWSECAYEDEYVKVDGEWRFQRYFCEIRMCVTHQDGWGDKMVDHDQFFAGWKAAVAE